MWKAWLFISQSLMDEAEKAQTEADSPLTWRRLINRYKEDARPGDFKAALTVEKAAKGTYTNRTAPR